jgi:P4 family phage/plasmid primase-like protien
VALCQSLLISAPDAHGKHQTWYEFVGHTWRRATDNKIRGYIGQEFLNEYFKLISHYNQAASEQETEEIRDQQQQKAKNLTDVSYKIRDYSFAMKIVNEAKGLLEDSTFESQLDQNPYLIGIKNGIYDLQSGTLRQGHPSDMVTLSIDYDYQIVPADNPLIYDINQFLSQLFPQSETRDYVFNLLASFIEGNNPHEKFHIWTGSGGNGKSKLIELVEKTLGPYCGKVPSTIFTQESRGLSSAASPELACLKVKRMVTTQEPDDPKHARPTINTGVIKDLTGNDKITCRALYGDQFEYKPQFKIIFCCNNLPDLTADDEGAWRRLSVVPFTSKFVDNPQNTNEFAKDIHLSQKFDSWKPVFLYLLLEQYKVYKKEGLNEPIQVKDAIKAYRRDVDDLQSFINENIKFEKDAYATLKDLWNAFQETEFYTKKMPQKQFKTSMAQKLKSECLTRKKIDNKDVYSVFMGVKLISKGSTDLTRCVL